MGRAGVLVVITNSASTNISGPLLVAIAMEADAYQFGTLAAVDRPEGNTFYAYDTAGRLIRQTDPDPGTGSPVTTWQYDALGELLHTTDPRQHTTDYEYDEMGRTTWETDPSPDGVAAGPLTVWTYDAAGRVSTVTDPAGRVTRYEYDHLGQRALTREDVKSISSITRSGSTVTGTSAGHGYGVGDQVVWATK